MPRHPTEQLQGVLRELMAHRHVRHAIAAVESGDGAFCWTGAAGAANPDGTPMRADTPFFTASVTKLYIAAVVLRLYERALIGLDRPIAEYLPQSLVAGLHRLGGVDRSGAITVRHLLSHTSGLPDWLEGSPKDGGPCLIDQLFAGEDRAISTAEAAQYVRDRLTPHFPPQDVNARRPKARYSDTNFQLLIAISEAVAGMPMHRVFEQELFRPLNLHQTFLPGYALLDPGPPPATIWAESQPIDKPLVLRSAGDLYSTAGDLLAFLRALIRGQVFDNPATADLMRERWNRFGFPLDVAALRSPNWPIEYGLGMMRFQLPRLFTLFRPVPAVIGHTGSTGSWLFYCPQLDLLLCGTVDQATAGPLPYKVVPKMLRIYAEAVRSS